MDYVKKALRWIISITLIAIIVINFTLIIKSEVNQNEIPDFLGYTPFIIVSGSMEPNIQINDVIITQKVKQEDIKVGDVISYKSGDIIITHRVTKIEQEDGQTVYTFKGDNNVLEDQDKVTYRNIHGKFLFSIPFIGTLVNYVKTPVGMCMVIGIIILIFVVFELIERMFENRDITKQENTKSNK